MENLSRAMAIEEGYSESRFEQIIGDSPSLKCALVDAERVAPTDANVLLLGETGTGKELLARAIHSISPRRDRPFVKLDCATIPFDLLESELFGHEAGAFPWAFSKNIGRFEMADKGTLFLDEIGDLPLGLQPKLLRILQEQEFERPGGRGTQRVNVRLLAATNRNLTEMVLQREFRSDLYYRLNGFPILLPPLRERHQDIPALVSHFVEIYSRRVGKRIQHIPKNTSNAFRSYSWPGNVRELRNLVERAVILSNDGVLPNLLRFTDDHSRPVISSKGALSDTQRASNHSRKVVSSSLPATDLHAITTTGGLGHEAPSSASPDLPIVFVVDDDVSFRESMEALLRRSGWQPETFGSAHEFLERPRPHVSNCLVIDVSLQHLNSLELQRRFAVERLETPIICIAGEGDVPTSVQAMKAGAVEFLIKPFSDGALLDAIREALRRSSISLGREAEMRTVRDRYASLSHRERQVMALVLSGLLNKQVGAELGISEITVKAHRGRVMQKMGAKSVVDLVKMATRLRSDRTMIGAGQFRSPSPTPDIASSASTVAVPLHSGGAALRAVSGRS